MQGFELLCFGTACFGVGVMVMMVLGSLLRKGVKKEEKE